jgi:6-phospho-beta-glucosidase
MKLAIIGGGGVRAPLLVAAALRRAREIHLEELCLLDIDLRRLELIGGLCQQIARQMDSPVRVVTALDAPAALDGAGYIVTTVRVGGEAGRVQDERIALSQGVLGQETTGPGGFAMAMRSVPAILEYARLAQSYAPHAWLFNFTNPAGLVAQALQAVGFERCVGICDGANLAQHDVARWLGLPYNQVRAEVFGLNHLSWARRVWVNNKDVLPELLGDPAFCAQSSLRVFEPALLRLLGLYPNEYLYYYYYAERALEQIQDEPRTRGEEILELNEALLKGLEQPEMRLDPHRALQFYLAYEERRGSTYMHYARRARQPEDAPGSASPPGASGADASPVEPSPEQSEGYAGVALDVIAALESGEAACTALNVPNRGAIDGMRADDVVEVSCEVTDGAIRPLPIGAVPETVAGLIESVKHYERLAVQAILQRSRPLAVQALMAHPLVLSYSSAARLVEAYLKVHAQFTGDWE